MQLIKFLHDNWAEIITVIVLILPAAETVTRLTPTKTDDTALDWFKRLFDIFVPNKKKGGGTF